MPNGLKYISQLDSLRTIAILLVVTDHWLGGFWTFGGGTGVILFFVLSGFLITRILLNSKYTPGVKRVYSIKNFIIRRSLRIFPIYFLFVFFFIIAGDPYMRLQYGWYLTYCSNIHFFLINNIDNAMYNHTWSLAVEEQFYLIWPWMILFIPEKKEPVLIFSMIVVAILFRYTLDTRGYYGLVLTPSNFDAFGLGALLAWLKLNETRSKVGAEISGFLNVYTKYFLVGFLLISLFLFNVNLPQSLGKCSPVLFQFFFSVFSMALINQAILGFTGILGRFFNYSAVLYIGKISYGIYLYHKVIPWALSYGLSKFGHTYSDKGFFSFFLQLLLVILVAHLSWIIIEVPMNRLKKRFEYAR